MKRFALTIVIVGLFLDSVQLRATGEDGSEKERIAEALRVTTAAAKTYQVTIKSAEGKTQCELHNNPILKWSNPVVGSIHGNVFLWTQDAQPVAVGSFFKWFSPWTHGTHEFQSLTPNPLRAVYEETEIWKPQTAGIKWSSLDEASTPASSKVRRLVQLRALANEFSVIKTTQDEESDRLRLLRQPVYRYESPQSKVSDGALFVFVQGTDPEVWLLIEAIKSDGSKSADLVKSNKHQLRWRYAFARMNTTLFEIKRKDKLVQKFPIMKDSSARTPTTPYFKINTEKLPRAAQIN